MLLEEGLFAQLREALELCHPDSASLADAMATSLRDAPQQDLLIDYAKLFVGPDVLLAHPYGSVYLDGPKVLMGDSTMDVIARYQDADFAVSPELKEVPDHIAIELEFLYLLCFNAALAQTEERTDDQQHWNQHRQQFIADHLGRWIDEFCGRLSNNTQCDYYRHLADLTQRFINAQKATA
nr:molecular chaperone TorD family protein [Pelovirga terrestris]